MGLEPDKSCHCKEGRLSVLVPENPHLLQPEEETERQVKRGCG